MKKVIFSFKEHKEFKTNKPWDVIKIHIKNGLITPPHYADTIEIIVFTDVFCEAHIGGKKIILNGGNNVFFIAPNVIHALTYTKSSGYVRTMKVNVKQLKNIFDIEKFLEHNKTDFTKFPIVIPEYDRFMEIADTFKNSARIGDIISKIIDIFHILMSYSDRSTQTLNPSYTYNEEIRPIIDWTEKNYTRRISLEEVSAKSGYTKEHFCRKFKALTGITYLTYLNSMRVFLACSLLKSGKSISQTCDECGFDDISYFIQLFKKITGTTPKKYARGDNE